MRYVNAAQVRLDFAPQRGSPWETLPKVDSPPETGDFPRAAIFAPREETRRL